MEVRQKETVKTVTSKDKLRQNANAELVRFDTTALDTKADIAVNTANNSRLRLNTSASAVNQQTNQQAAEVQRKYGQYRMAQKQYTLRRNNSCILRSKQTAERTASANNTGQYGNDWQNSKGGSVNINSTRRMSIGSKNNVDKRERINNNANQPRHTDNTQLHHANSTRELTNSANILLLKKAAADLRTQQKIKATQNIDRKSEQLTHQENESSDTQTPQRNVFDVANEEALDKISYHGQRAAHRIVSQMREPYRQYAYQDQEQRMAENHTKHSQAAVQEQFKRTRNAQSLREKQNMRQTAAATQPQTIAPQQPLPARRQQQYISRKHTGLDKSRESQQTGNLTYAAKPTNAITQTQNTPNNQQIRILRSKSHLRDPTESSAVDNNPLNTGRYIPKLHSSQQTAGKISSASHSNVNFKIPFCFDSHSAQKLTTEQIQQKRKSAAIRNLLKKRINKKAAIAKHTTSAAFDYGISSSGSIFSLAAEQRFIRIIQTAGRTIKSLLLSLISAGTMILLVLAFFAAFAALLFSPFGIFFSGQDADNQTLAMAVADITKDFNTQLDTIEANAQADRVIYHRLPTGEGRFITNWTDIAAVFAVRTAGGNDSNSMDVLTIDGTRIELLKAIFTDMNIVSYEIETITSADPQNNDECVLHITITSKSYTDMPDLYHFTTAQRQALEEIMKPEYAQMLSELVGTYGSGAGGSIVVTDTDLQALLAQLPDTLSPQRKVVIQTAFSLVGKVNYFWGGKSHVIGWDNRWGTPTKVTAAGSRTTGTTRPFGLDCSGFVDWVFINAVDTNVGQGGGAAAQYHNSLVISWAEARAGDLVFYPDLGHVGIICGKDNNGNLLVVHCASSQNNVVVTGLGGFTKIRRPVVFSD